MASLTKLPEFLFRQFCQCSPVAFLQAVKTTSSGFPKVIGGREDYVANARVH